jgi:signal-transduction protein with cAMP-binding, CBS, and nucleotidyltransferase domain
MKLKPEQELNASLLLANLPLFTGCPKEALQAIVKCLDARDVLPGKVLMMDQEIGRTLYLLSSGSVSVWKRIGGEKKQLAKLTAPNFFGERSMFEESPASALVKTEERSLIYALERAQFNPIAAQFPGILDPIKKNMEDVRQKRMGPTPPPIQNPA